jgi:hypothetical protein
MADTLRVVTFSAGGRPILVRDLNDITGYFRDRDAGTTFTPAQAATQYSRRAKRYGGARAVGQTHDNAALAWTAYVRGSSVTQAAQRVEQLLVDIENAARGRYIEFAPEGVASSYAEIAGPGSWAPTYQPREFADAQAMRVQLTFPVLPLVQWARMTVIDPFDVDSEADYTYDAGTTADTAVTGGAMTPVVGAALTAERRARHTARGYDLLEGQATLKATPVTTITSFKAGVLQRATSASNYIEVYVDDNGTNSRLRVDVVIAGVRTNRSSTNLAARLVTATPAWVRGRIEGNVVTAEYFASAPTPMAAPTLTASYTLVGGDAPLNTTAGKAGWSWIPQNASATLDDFEFRPYTYRNQTLPTKLAPSDNIPGNAPALADVTFTPSGGAAAPVFAYVAWGRRAGTPAAGVAPFAILEAESAGDLTGWVSAADAGSRGGNRLIDATVSGAETYTASWVIDPSALTADDFTDNEITLEVFAVLALSSTLVSPRFTLSARPQAGTAFGAERFTSEWGNTGVGPTAVGAAVRRLVRLGSLRLPADAPMKLWLAASTAAGSTGTIGADYLIIGPARARALSPTAKANDTGYPRFVGSTAETSKRVRADLSALVSQPPNTPIRDHGLGGSLIEPPSGAVDWLLKLSSLVPDDPTVDSTTEQLAHAATVSLDLIPRSYLLRA